MDRTDSENNESKHGRAPKKDGSWTKGHPTVFPETENDDKQIKSGSYIPDGTIEIRL